MRKIAAISLICLLVFNWYGYRFVTGYFQKKADSQLEAKIDVNDYDESQLIEIRVALDMPYQNSSSEFERHYGEIEINGKIYAYVKQDTKRERMFTEPIRLGSKKDSLVNSKERIAKVEKVEKTTQPEKTKFHTVKRGDNLSEIAQEYLKDTGYFYLPIVLPEKVSFRSIQNEGKAISEIFYKSLRKQAKKLIESILDYV